jgi:U4/U6 small nuclear ribonucleoprotein PRP31
LQDIAEEGENDEFEDDEMADIEALNYDDLDTVAKLQKSQRFHDIMEVASNLLFQFLHRC